jgi:hypothetical protein
MQRKPDDAGQRRQAVPDSMRARQSKKRSEPKQLLSLFSAPGLPTLSSADSLSAEPSTSANPSPHRPVLHGNLQVQDALSRVREEDSRGGVWDADFASDITLAQIQSASYLELLAVSLTCRSKGGRSPRCVRPRHPSTYANPTAW